LLIQSPLDPDGDNYGLYLQSLHQVEMMVDQETLVLPGRHVPFHGLRPAIAALKASHGGRVERVQTESRQVPRSIPELAPLLFPGKMNGRKMHYAVFEILAYINRPAAKTGWNGCLQTKSASAGSGRLARRWRARP